MRIVLAAALAGLLLPLLVPAQKLELKLDSLAAKAKEKAEVDLEGSALEAALKAGQLGRKMPHALTAVHVRNYQFSKPGEYSDSDLAPLRGQLGEGSGWSRIVQVKEPHESAEIFVLAQAGEFRGLLVVACEPAEVSVVHLAGVLAPEQVKELVTSNIRYDLTNLPLPAPR